MEKRSTLPRPVAQCIAMLVYVLTRRRGEMEEAYTAEARERVTRRETGRALLPPPRHRHVSGGVYIYMCVSRRLRLIACASRSGSCAVTGVGVRSAAVRLYVGVAWRDFEMPALDASEHFAYMFIYKTTHALTLDVIMRAARTTHSSQHNLEKLESILDAARLGPRGDQDEAALTADPLDLIHAEAARVVDALDERALCGNERLEEGNRPRRTHAASEVIAPPVD